MKQILLFLKLQHVSFLLILLFSIVTQEGIASNNPLASDLKSKQYTFVGAGNPYLPLWEHLPDGEPRVFEDPDNPGKYRIYIIGSHDVRVKGYCGMDTRAWSAPIENLSEWRDDGPIFSHRVDQQSDIFYAPDLVEIVRKDGKKEYYLYPHSRGKNRVAMVAKSDRPDGPFIPINLTEDGRKALAGSVMGFDPAVYIDYVTDPKDPDFDIGFRAYGYWGFKRSKAGQLDQNTMYSIRPGTELIDYFIPAGKKYGTINDPKGTKYPNVFEGEDLGRFNFFEAASIRKIGNKFIWVYSGYSGPEYGLSSTNSALRYAYGDSPLGPWKSGGVLVDSRAPVLNKNGDKIQTSYSGHNTHGSIEFINDQWYAFYHRAPRSFGYARQAMVAPVIVNWDKKSVAEGGKVTISAYDPFTPNKKWSAKDSQGVEYKGAEVTSEGFHIYGLDPYQYYSAGYASYLSNPQSQDDSWDMWDNNMPISKVKSGNIIGYKYFGFGGLAQNKKGLKAFEGSKQGKNTVFNAFITPKSKQAFKINVWLDGPWDNETWQGTKIGVINVPANSTQQITKFNVDVAKAVDHLDKKHAIFLTAEGESNESLFDLIGLGFSSKTNNIVRPIAPTVTINVNGKAIKLPETPVRATNDNGIVSYNLYQAVFPLTRKSKTPKVSASASNKAVKISIIQAKSTIDTAVVKFNYKGVEKTYNLVFTTS